MLNTNICVDRNFGRYKKIPTTPLIVIFGLPKDIRRQETKNWTAFIKAVCRHYINYILKRAINKENTEYYEHIMTYKITINEKQQKENAIVIIICTL